MIIPKDTYKYLSNLINEEYNLLIERERIIDKKSFEAVYFDNRRDLYLIPKRKNNNDSRTDMNRYIKYLKNQDAKISKISNTEMDGVHLVINNLKNIKDKL